MNENEIREVLGDGIGEEPPIVGGPAAVFAAARSQAVRTRAVTGALSMVAVLGVAAGAVAFSGGSGGASDRVSAASGGARPGAAAAGGAAAAVPAVATTPATPTVDNDRYGKTVVAQGDFDGTHWTLTRDLNLQEKAAIPAPGKDAKATKEQSAFDDVYITGPNGLRDRAAGGGNTAPGHLAEILNHFGRQGADVAASTSVTTLGTGTMDDPWKKDKASPYGIDFVSGIVSSKVARVQVVLDGGTSADAKLVAAPAGEDGQYFFLPFKAASGHVRGHVVFYDDQGQVLPSLISQF